MVAAIQQVSRAAIGRASLVEEIAITMSRRILLTLAFAVGALFVGTNNNDGDGRVLQAEFRYGAREQALDTTEGSATCTDDEDGRFVEFDLFSALVSRNYDFGDKWNTYHSSKHLFHLTHGELQDQIHRLILAIPPFNILHQRHCLLLIIFSLRAHGNLRIRVYNSQTYHLIPIVYQFIDQPFQGIFTVIVCVEPAEEGT